MAGVSKRTIDYYTNLGLITPISIESRYRYYSKLTLVRLKMIEHLKEKRYTLEEIKQHLLLLEQNLVLTDNNQLDLLNTQIEALKKQLTELQDTVCSLNINKNKAVKEKFLQGVALIQSLTLYIDEITSLIQL